MASKQLLVNSPTPVEKVFDDAPVSYWEISEITLCCQVYQSSPMEI